MIVVCDHCQRLYDDAEQWTLCPHGPLWAGWEDYCREHDLVACPFDHDTPPREGRHA